jgi:hypothetical protein
VFQVGLTRLRFSRGNSDVMVAAHGFSLSEELAQILLETPRPKGGILTNGERPSISG